VAMRSYEKVSGVGLPLENIAPSSAFKCRRAKA